MITLNEYLDVKYKGIKGHQITEHVVCKSGLTMSVQAGIYQYSTPRDNSPIDSYSYYTHFEVGYPDRQLTKLMPYVEDATRPTDTVYPYVPREVIETIIEENGGLKMT
jgi:hypothetical protein